MKIGDLCDVRTGHAFRQTPTHAPDGAVFLVQPKNIVSDGVICLQNLCRIDIETSKPLQVNDVLLVSRGRLAAAVFAADNGNRYIASSAFLILSIKHRSVLPEYVALYLNSTKGRRRLGRYVEKTTIPYVSARNLRTMSIPVPPLEKQRTLIQLQKINRDFARLSSRKLELQKQIVNHELTGEIGPGIGENHE